MSRTELIDSNSKKIVGVNFSLEIRVINALNTQVAIYNAQNGNKKSRSAFLNDLLTKSLQVK